MSNSVISGHLSRPTLSIVFLCHVYPYLKPGIVTGGFCIDCSSNLSLKSTKCDTWTEMTFKCLQQKEIHFNPFTMHHNFSIHPPVKIWGIFKLVKISLKTYNNIRVYESLVFHPQNHGPEMDLLHAKTIPKIK